MLLIGFFLPWNQWYFLRRPFPPGENPKNRTGFGWERPWVFFPSTTFPPVARVGHAAKPGSRLVSQSQIPNIFCSPSAPFPWATPSCRSDSTAPAIVPLLPPYIPSDPLPKHPASQRGLRAPGPAFSLDFFLIPPPPV